MSRIALSPAEAQHNEQRSSFLEGKLAENKHFFVPSGDVKNGSVSYSRV